MNDNTLLAICIVAPLILYGWVAYLVTKEDATATSLKTKKRMPPPSILDKQIPWSYTIRKKYSNPKSLSKENIQKKEEKA